MILDNPMNIKHSNFAVYLLLQIITKAESKEFEPRLKYESRINHGSFHLKLYLVFQDLSRPSIETVFFADQQRSLNFFNSASGMIMIII